MKISMAFQHILLNVGLILILIIILSTVKLTKNETEMNYTYLKPLHYNVKIKFDVFSNVFSAKCNIIIQINRPTKNITMLSSKIFGIAKIDLINNNDNQTINIQKISFINKTYIYFDFTQSSDDLLSPGTYILKMIYVSNILDVGDTLDLFQIKEKDKIFDNGFKVIKAGELFPSWDNAIFKSTFNISIWHHKNYTFLSNMPIKKQVEDMDNMLWTHFDISPLMSAEHLTIVMITFTNFFAPIRNVKIWYRKEMIDQLRLAEDVVYEVMQYLVQKNIRKISKIDYVVTKDFEYSNVKTLELILLREEDIIYNYTLDDIARKIKVANLVTRETISKWYDDVLLLSNEGFITFLTAHILDQTLLYYRMMDLFVVQTQQESLRFDTLFTNSLPFKRSRYNIKSSIVWRMLYHLMSDHVFWNGINTYVNIKYNQTNVTDTNNLSTSVPFWTAMASALNVTNNTISFNIKDIIDAWLTEEYYPVLYLTQDFSINLASISFINFNRTLLPGMKEYRVRVTYTTKSLMNFKIPNTKEFTSHFYDMYWTNKNDWIIVNLQQAGYYRVNYNSDNWQKLAHHLYFVNYADIHVLNRAQIIDDAFYFLTQRQLNFVLFWNITKFLFEDADYVAWYPMIKAVEYMMCTWPIKNTTAVKMKLTRRFDRLLLNIGYMDKLNFENDFTKILREEAIKWACILDVPRCRETAIFQLGEHLESSVQDKLLKRKEWIYCKGLMAANFNIWHKVWNRWNATSDNTILEYLTCSTNTDIIKIYLELISKNKFDIRVSNSETSAIFLLIVAKHAKRDAVLEFIFGLLKFKMKGEAVKQIATLIVIITHQHDAKQFKQVHDFVKNKLMNEKQLSFIVDAVKQKIEKRKMEQRRRVRNFGLLK
nr:PREDICTED: thyrotropin-releasing hormone-degrading ectoenzyme-like [Linepithema humile]